MAPSPRRALILIAGAALGATPAAAAADEPQRPEAEAQVSTLGRVTYAEASAGVPISARASIVPAVELLHLSPVASDPRREIHPYLGAGVAAEEPGDWAWELAATYGPRASGLASFGGSVEISKGFRAGGGARGADGDGQTHPGRGGRARPAAERPRAGTSAARDADPDLELSLSADATFYSWRPPSPVGGRVAQLSIEAGARARLGAHLRARAQGILFGYDRLLAPRTADDVDALSVLARVGTYAPRAFLGTRFYWNISGAAAPAVEPLVEIDGLAYAAGVGAALRVEAGLRIDFGRGFTAALAGGLLHNRLDGVAAQLDDQRTVPLFDVNARLAF